MWLCIPPLELLEEDEGGGDDGAAGDEELPVDGDIPQHSGEAWLDYGQALG